MGCTSSSGDFEVKVQHLNRVMKELERDVKKIRLAEDLVDLKDPTSTYAARLESARQRFRAEARGPVQVNFTSRDSLLSFKNQTYV